jgi:hypothetical protein
MKEKKERKRVVSRSFFSPDQQRMGHGSNVLSYIHTYRLFTAARIISVWCI